MRRPETDPRRFVITGCGRSATMYIAELLTELGCECGHEDYFPAGIGATTYRLAQLGLRRLSWRPPPYGEAAWEAAPFLHLLPRDTVVFHQLRHPLEFVRSRQRKGLSRAAFRDRHMSVSSGVTNKYRFWELPIEQQVRYLTDFWIEWNYLVEQNAANLEYYRYRTGDMSAEHVSWMLETVNCPVELAEVRKVHTRTSRDVNKGKSPNERVQFELLPSSVYDRLVTACDHYGFEL